MSRTLEITERCLGATPKIHDAPDWINQADNPYLHGIYAPTLNTNTHTEALEVIGELPTDLYGAYLRNGPNPVFKPKHHYHPFDGDGMIHGVFFNEGRVAYRNNLIDTACLMQERDQGEAVWPGVMGPFDFSLPDFPIKDTANTDIILHNGRLMSLWYNSGIPYLLDPLTLANLGPLASPSRLSRRLSAHSRLDWFTGELFFFDYGDEVPYMIYGVMNPDGSLKHEVGIDLPGPRLPHEIAFTGQHAILHDHPFFHDVEVLRKFNARVVQFHRHLPTRFGLIPRLGTEVRWFEFEPCYVLHTSNAWEDGEWVVIDGCRSANPMPKANPDEGVLAHMLSYMRLEANNYRWQINTKTNEVREGPICDLNSDFNKSNPLFHGIKTRYAYHQAIPLLEDGGHTLRFTALLKYDNELGTHQRWEYGAGVFGSEAAFAPKRGVTRDGEEDDGYVITLVTDSKDWTSSCLIFDAKDIGPGPIATVRLPQRIPAGFHAGWARGEELGLTA